MLSSKLSVMYFKAYMGVIRKMFNCYKSFVEIGDEFFNVLRDGLRTNEHRFLEAIVNDYYIYELGIKYAARGLVSSKISAVLKDKHYREMKSRVTARIKILAQHYGIDQDVVPK